MKRGASVRSTILVADDDAGLRESLHLILEDEYEVIDAADGSQALAILATGRIDLVILDLVMSGVDGFEVLERLSEAEKPVPIIVLSALNISSTTATAMRLGAVEYLTKPFDEEILLGAVKEGLSSRICKQARVTPAMLPRALLVGVDLGIHVSLTLLLRSRYQVTHVPDFDTALEYVNVSPPNILILNWPSLGAHAGEKFESIRRLSSDARLVVIGSGNSLGSLSPVPCSLLTAPARVSVLLKEIRALPRVPAEARDYSSRVSAAIDYLGHHCAVASVRQVGRAVGTAPHYLSTLFRTETGFSLRAYINQLRVEAAKCLLLETGEKLDTVAAQVGFHDASHLSRFFLKNAGDRPGAYRRHRSTDREGHALPRTALKSGRGDAP